MSARATIRPCFASDRFLSRRGSSLPDMSYWYGSGFVTDRTPGIVECTRSDNEYHLQSKPHYTDFALDVKVRYPGTTSGRYPRVYIRAPDLFVEQPYYGFSFGVSNYPSQSWLECRFYTSSAPPVMVAQVPAALSNQGWYDLHIEASGSTLVATVNDRVSLTVSSELYPEGSVDLCAMNDTAQFRDLLLYDAQEGMDFLVTEIARESDASGYGGPGASNVELTCKALGSSSDGLLSYLGGLMDRAAPVVAMTPAGTFSGYIGGLTDGVRRNTRSRIADLKMTIDLMDVR